MIAGRGGRSGRREPRSLVGRTAGSSVLGSTRGGRRRLAVLLGHLSSDARGRVARVLGLPRGAPDETISATDASTIAPLRKIRR